MRFFSLLALAIGASAAATGAVERRGPPPPPPPPGPKKCLKKPDVDFLVAAYKSILTNWTPDKANLIADNGFFDYSDSINTVAGLPTGFPIFPNKTAFVGYESTTPDNIPLVVVEVGPYNCEQITVIWSATFTKVPGGTPSPVRGITVLEGVFDEHKHQWEIQSIKVEFNSINYYKNTGGVCTRPAPPS
ncbi:hypothetical protein QBC47DRAFT_415989 [Echria macrotheca]|uniref:NTF2-like domain-containing protein n=1 Tax=Echria macrotheca TaxID=438768 RepID=A0AAJ0B7U9_9PEZI|nr:hypothetical protein QBC47DRAFT_415989 [Echria macrotheca]